MNPLRYRLAGLAITGLFLLLPSLALRAQTAREARLPVRIVGDRLVVRCDVSTRFRRIAVNLFLDYGRPCGLELHNRAAAGLRLDESGGSRSPCTSPASTSASRAASTGTRTS